MSNYLIHYNKNHNPKNGQFALGDGNSDGIINNRKNQKTSKEEKAKNRRILKSGTILVASSFVATAATRSLSALSEQLDQEGDKKGATAAKVGAIIAGVSDIALFSAGIANVYRGRARIKNEK